MKSLSILIAEDEVLTRVDIKEILEKGGHFVCGECGNGLKAIELAKQTMPDLVVLDIMMPQLDGIEAAKILHTLNIPVVMLTAYSQPGMINRAENVYVYGYLVKPVSEQNLLATVRIAYARWQDMKHVSGELAEAKEQFEKQKIIARARAILRDDRNLSEQEAHKQLLKEAMQRRLPLVEWARQIIGGGKQ